MPGAIAKSCRTRRQADDALALRFHQDVGQAIAVAVGADSACQYEDVGIAIGGEYLALGPCAAPLDALGEAASRRLAAQRLAQGAAADMDEAPMKLGRQQRQRGDEVVIALLGDRAPDREDADGPRSVSAVARAGVGDAGPGQWKAGEIEPVIGERDAPGWGKRGEVGMAGRRAGHQPAAIGEFFAFFPLRNRPDVLGMRRDRPRQAAQQRRIAGDRGRGVEEMRVQMADAVRQLARQDERLAEAADSIRRRVALEIAQPGRAGRCIAFQPARVPPAAQHPERRAVEIFRQIEHRRADLAVDGVQRAVRRPSQRDDAQV